LILLLLSETINRLGDVGRRVEIQAGEIEYDGIHGERRTTVD